MQNFPGSFLILLYQIALGGLFGVAATPFQDLERGFYKSTGGVLFVIGFLGLWGHSDIYLNLLSRGMDPISVLTVTLHLLFILSFALYMVALWGEWKLFRARMFSCTLLTGLIGLTLSAQRFTQAPLWSVETLLYPLSFILSAMLLGSVTVGMLIGHWYLIDTGQSLDPFIRIFKFFVAALVVQTVFLFLLPLGLYFFGTPTTRLGLERLWANHSTLLIMRAAITLAAPLILSYMIWRTLKIPHTMAATGLFYIALLGVFAGEILGRQILALTTLPF